MKSIIFLIVFLSSLFSITGCTPNNSLETYETNKENVISIEDEKIEISDGLEPEFSYINGLSEEELNAYKLFTKEYDTNYLKGISPEKIMLIYIHSAVIDDIEAIYSLAYNNGDFPDFDTFKKKYYDNLMISNLEMALDFRYYDSVEVKQNSEDSNELKVEMRISFGGFATLTSMELKKQNDIWKVDLLHLLEK